MTGGVQIRPLRGADLAWTAALQREALPHGFFARLGTRVLRDYQRTFLDSPYGIALAAEADGEPLGFLVGTADADAHREWVFRRRRARMLAAGLPALAAHPRVLARFVRTRAARYLGRLAKTAAPGQTLADPPPAGPRAVLTHVAVDPGRRRSGAGRALADAFLAEAHARGATHARLTTLHDDRGAEDFWAALGWSKGAVVTDDDGRRHRIFVRNF